MACYQASTTTTSTSYSVSAPGAASWAVFDTSGTDLTFAGGTNPLGSTGLFTVPNGASYTVYAVGSTGLTAGRTTVSPGGGSSSTATRTLTYISDEGGKISGTTQQTVNLYDNGTAVTAVPDSGYRFVMWSDGVRSATRTDTAVTSNVDVEAVFLPIIDYTLAYTAGPGGHVSGLLSQTATYGADGTAVTAIANRGYYFAGWSDGVTSATRTEEFVTSDTSATATFAPRKVTSLLLKSSCTSLKHGHYITLTASLRGGVPGGAKVVFQVKAPGKRSYATIGTVGTSSLSVAVRKYTVASRGTYYFRVVFAGSTVFKASTSSAVKVISKESWRLGPTTGGWPTTVVGPAIGHCGRPAASVVLTYDRLPSRVVAPDSVLVRTMDPKAIVVGEGFRLGRRAASGVGCIRQHLAPIGCAVI